MLTDPHFSLPRLTRFDTRDDDLSTTPLSRIAREHGVGAEAVDTMLEMLPVAVFMVDRDGHVVYANAQARTLRADRLDRIQWAVTRACSRRTRCAKTTSSFSQTEIRGAG